MPNFIKVTVKSIPLLAILLLLIGCQEQPKPEHPVERVIKSMEDSLPRIALPADADPDSEDWAGIDLEPKPPVLPLFPSEQQKKFLLPDGYSMEAVLTEPAIEQPAAIAFDGNGRMYVLELRSYMLTADSDGTLEPVSRISRWEDLDEDGVYEKGTAFVDSLIFPRFVLPYGKDCILTMESDADNVYKYTDTDGDGKADKKEFFTNKYGRSGNVEHQQAFMYYGMDNWMYSTVNAFRIRETPAGIVREKTGYNHAQWGLTHDDDGKLWFQGGASGLPSYFQFPIHYGNIEVEDQFADGFEIPYGAPIKLADLQGGMDEVRQPDGSLNRVTGASGNDVFRGHRLPADLYGHYLYGEPVARIVRRIRPEVTDGITRLHNVYQEEQSEFIRSTDPLFRPVDMATAPDGTLYVVDMYHGIIQEGQWAQKGTYLRAKIEQYQLDKVVGLGRIWRLKYDGIERDKKEPAMLDAPPSTLLKHLSHPNGWWRDKAQQLIVLSGDQSLVPELKQMALAHENLFARFHALWSLEGLGSLDELLLAELLNDPNPRIRIQALRAGESIIKAGKQQLADEYIIALQDPEADVAIQAMLSVKFLQLPGYRDHIRKTSENSKVAGIQLVGKQLLGPPQGPGFWAPKLAELNPDQQQQLERGGVIFNELCVQCHGRDGGGTPLGDGNYMAPSLSGSPRVQSHPDYVIKTLLYGLQGPLDGKNFPGGIMVGMGEQSDQWIADIASYIRHNLSNEASFVNARQVETVRKNNPERKKPYRFEELVASVPRLLTVTPDWKVSASHSAPTRIGGTNSPRSAFNFEGWSTGESQEPGMWFQVEFPAMVQVSELHFNAPPKRKGWGPEAPPPVQTYPRAYKLTVSTDGKKWKKIAEGAGDSEDISIVFEAQAVKYLRISQTAEVAIGEDEIPWNMRQMKIYGYSAKEVGNGSPNTTK